MLDTELDAVIELDAVLDMELDLVVETELVGVLDAELEAVLDMELDAVLVCDDVADVVAVVTLQSMKPKSS